MLSGKQEFFPSPSSWCENDSTFLWLARSITLLKGCLLCVCLCVFLPQTALRGLKIPSS